MTKTVEARVIAKQDVQALARIVDVFALYDLTPTLLVSRRCDEELHVQAQFVAEDLTTDRCAARLRAQISVKSVHLERLIRSTTHSE